MRRRRTRATAAAVAVLGMTATSASAMTALLALPPVPVSTGSALGDQPQVPVGPCTFPRLGAGEIRTLLSQAPSPHGTNRPLTRDTVDPFTPCHVLQVPDGNRVARSDDSGRRFSTVLAPPAGWLPARNTVTDGVEPVTLSAVVTPALDEEYVIDTTGPYGVLHSGDGGVHWDQRNQGLPLAGGLSTLRTLTFAPSNPRVGYVVVVAAGTTPLGQTSSTTLLFQTADGGGSWSEVPVAAPGITASAVDPGDERHVFLTDGGGGGGRSPVVLESSDAGSSWSQHPLPSAYAFSPLSILASRTRQSDRVRLYVKTTTSGGVHWLRSVDGGMAWSILPVSPSRYDQTLIADPTDADRMVLAATTSVVDASTVNDFPLTLYMSQDGFATVQQAQLLPASWAWVGASPAGVDPLRLTTDHAHDFFLEVVTTSGTLDTTSDHLFAFQLGGVAALASSAPPADSAGLAIAGAPVATPLHACSLPSPYTGQRPPPTVAGSLTYDGRYLDYTQDNVTPAVTGLIERVDPVTCRPTPPLRPSLPGDPTNNGAPPVIQQLTYDARYVFAGGHRGAILVLASRARRDYGHDPDPFPIYAVDPLDGTAELALLTPPNLVGTTFPTDTGLAPYFSYDVGDDDLWVSLSSSGVVRLHMPAVHGEVAAATGTCVDGIFNTGRDTVATVIAVAGGGMYAQLEDDKTVVHLNDRSCSILGGFAHAQFAEPNDENEQIACDPITDGDASATRGAGGALTSLLWVRDSLENVVSAYAIPSGFCPFPTTLALAGLPPVPAGAPVSLCAVLRRATADRIPIGGQVVSFRVDGQPAGSGRTDDGGRACTTTAAPAVAGAHRVDAHFGGTSISFLPSSAEGPLLTYLVAARVHAGQAAPLLVVETPVLPLPQPVPQAEIAPQAQAEAQMQAQAQTQTVTQVQPGVMMQRQRQVQAAAERVPSRLSQPAYQASALRRSPRVQPVAVLAAVLLLGAGLLVRRPALAPMRIRKR